jgi:Trypsin-co-occurring domain 1
MATVGFHTFRRTGRMVPMLARTRGAGLPPKIVTYALDDSTKVRFEIDPPTGFQDAAADKVIGKVTEALAPAIDTAKLVLDKVKETRPDEVSVKFGIKVSGKLDWFVAKAATEGNFEITLTWKPGQADTA